LYQSTLINLEFLGIYQELSSNLTAKPRAWYVELTQVESN
jgi:hypothetical protein